MGLLTKWNATRLNDGCSGPCSAALSVDTRDYALRDANERGVLGITRVSEHSFLPR